MIELIKVNENSWRVVLNNSHADLPSIEFAADLLEAQGVQDKEIDEAIVYIHATGHKKAHFGLNGTFLFTTEK